MLFLSERAFPERACFSPTPFSLRGLTPPAQRAARDSLTRNETMSDHNWVLENLESYSAGGLDAQERERLESHLPECSSCSQALHDIRASDQQLENLFA